MSPILCQTDLRITKHRGHKFPPSITLLSFKTQIKLPPVLTATASFPSVFFQHLQYPRKDPSFSAYKPALMTKTDSIYAAFSLRFVDFAFSFLEKPFESSLTAAWFFYTNHNSLLCIATNEIASFCILDNTLCQMAFFVFTKRAKASFWVPEKDFEIKKAEVCKTKRFHVAMHLFSNRSQGMSKCGKNISDTLGYRLMCHFLVLTTIWLHLIVIYYWTDAWQHGICLLKYYYYNIFCHQVERS